MFKYFSMVALAAAVVFVAASTKPQASPTSAPEVNPDQGKSAEGSAFVVNGRTQCAPGKKGTIAPVPLHPVVEVLAKAGDRVKKEQVLVKLDDDEPQADVRNKIAVLEAAKECRKEAVRYFKRVEETFKNAAIAEASYFAALTASLKAVHDEKAAEAAMESAKAELEHYEVVAPIDGVISWLDVNLGTVSRPGTTVWGEILDLSEIDVKCELTIEQVEKLQMNQSVDVTRQAKKNGPVLQGKVAFVGIQVDAKSGLVPVLVRVHNPDAVLRCGEAVQVRVGEPK